MNKFGYLLAGGVSGGILGYLIADFLAYKMDEALFDDINEDLDNAELVGGMDKELYEFDERDGDNKKINYASVDDDKAELEELVRPYQDEKAPFIVSVAEWDDTISSFVQKTVLYYEHDGVYCDDQEVLIEDPENMFVPNAHLHFGQESDDPDAVYISNPGRSEMYEILRMKASYAVNVLGEVPADSPKEDSPKKPANQSGSPKERAKKEAEELGDVDDENKNN